GWSRLVKSLSLSLALAPLMAPAGGPALAQSHAGHAGHAPAAQAAPSAKPAHDCPMMRDGKPCPMHGAAATGAQADPHAGHDMGATRGGPNIPTSVDAVGGRLVETPPPAAARAA